MLHPGLALLSRTSLVQDLPHQASDHQGIRPRDTQPAIQLHSQGRRKAPINIGLASSPVALPGPNLVNAVVALPGPILINVVIALPGQIPANAVRALAQGQTAPPLAPGQAILSIPGQTALLVKAISHALGPDQHPLTPSLHISDPDHALNLIQPPHQDIKIGFAHFVMAIVVLLQTAQHTEEKTWPRILVASVRDFIGHGFVNLTNKLLR